MTKIIEYFKVKIHNIKVRHSWRIYNRELMKIVSNRLSIVYKSGIRGDDLYDFLKRETEKVIRSAEYGLYQHKETKRLYILRKEDMNEES